MVLGTSLTSLYQLHIIEHNYQINVDNFTYALLALPQPALVVLYYNFSLGSEHNRRKWFPDGLKALDMLDNDEQGYALPLYIPYLLHKVTII